MAGKTEQLVGQLAAGVDMERALAELQITPTQAIGMLRSKCGRRMIAVRRRLAKIHADIVAARFSGYAVHRICELLSSEKPELRLKGALSLLEIADLGKAARRKLRKPEPIEATPEDMVLVGMLARLLEQEDDEPPVVMANAMPEAVAQAAPGERE